MQLEGFEGAVAVMTELAVQQTQPDTAIDVRCEDHRVWNLLHSEFLLHREVANAQQLRLYPGDARPDITVAILGDRRHEAEVRAAVQSVDAPEVSVVVQRQLGVEADPETPGPVLPERRHVPSRNSHRRHPR